MKSNANRKGDDITHKHQSLLFEEFDMVSITMAISTLNNILDEISHGTVCLQDMVMIYERKSQVEKLCAAEAQYNVDNLRILFQRRFDECTAFKQRKNELAGFCREMEAFKIQIKGWLMMFLTAWHAEQSSVAH